MSETGTTVARKTENGAGASSGDVAIEAARIEAVGRVLSAYVTVANHPPAAEQLQRWATDITKIIRQVE